MHTALKCLKNKILFINIIMSKLKKETKHSPWNARKQTPRETWTRRKRRKRTLRSNTSWIDRKSLQPIEMVAISKLSSLYWKMTRWSNNNLTTVWMFIRITSDHNNNHSGTGKWRSNSWCKGKIFLYSWEKTYLGLRRKPPKATSNAMLSGDFGQLIKNGISIQKWRKN